jgi:EAL domain-containing protein (putative c-di-GMP-specific phosphodiesterase class I)
LSPVAGVLAATGLEAANLLELEVTERTVMHDAEINLGTLSALNRMGVELSLDDFGTGYSSLGLPETLSGR